MNGKRSRLLLGVWFPGSSIKTNDSVEQPFSLALYETLIGPNHHEGSLRTTLSLELGISDARAIQSSASLA